MASRDKGWPADLAREILLRLPVKSLLRFKCDCMNWYGFIKQHLNCSNKNNTKAKLLVHSSIAKWLFPKSIFGFRLDPLTSDYKVVCFTFSFNYEIPHYGACSVYAAVYSWFRDSWKFFSPDNVKISNYCSCCPADSTAYQNALFFRSTLAMRCLERLKGQIVHIA